MVPSRLKHDSDDDVFDIALGTLAMLGSDCILHAAIRNGSFGISVMSARMNEKSSSSSTSTHWQPQLFSVWCGSSIRDCRCFSSGIKNCRKQYAFPSDHSTNSVYCFNILAKRRRNLRTFGQPVGGTAVSWLGIGVSGTLALITPVALESKMYTCYLDLLAYDHTLPVFTSLNASSFSMHIACNNSAICLHCKVSRCACSSNSNPTNNFLNIRK